MKGKRIFDPCCGSRMFYFNKNNPFVHFNDIRSIETELCDGRKLIVNPDTNFDARHLPFAKEYFNLIIFDPPHLVNVGSKSWLAQKYGKLDKQTAKDDIKQMQIELSRILSVGGTIIYKWNERDFLLKDMMFWPDNIIPIMRHTKDKTHFVVLYKVKED